MGDLSELAETFRDAHRDVMKAARPVVARGALNVKRDIKRRWDGLGHAPALPRAVSYDVTVEASQIEAEIGPDKDRPQGALGNLLEFGSINNAPIPAVGPAIKAEEERFLRALEDVIEDLLW